MYNIMLSAYKDSFTSFLSIWVSFILDTMLNRSHESEYSCLAPE